MAFDQPSGVVDLAEGEQRLAKLLEGLEGVHPQQILLEDTDKTLGAAVSLGCPHKGGRAFDAEEVELVLKGVGYVLRAMVMPDGKTASDALGEAAETGVHT